MIPIESEEQKVSFLEFSLEIPKDLIHAFKVYAQVRDASQERPKTQWLELYQSMMKKKTT